jgi:hypothetical protein
MTSALRFENVTPAILEVAGRERIGTPDDDLIPDILPGVGQNLV